MSFSLHLNLTFKSSMTIEAAKCWAIVFEDGKVVATLQQTTRRFSPPGWKASGLMHTRKVMDSSLLCRRNPSSSGVGSVSREPVAEGWVCGRGLKDVWNTPRSSDVDMPCLSTSSLTFDSSGGAILTLDTAAN